MDTKSSPIFVLINLCNLDEMIFLLPEMLHARYLLSWSFSLMQDPAQSQMYIPASLAKAFPSLTKLCISNMGFSNLSQNILSFLPDLTHLSLTNNELISLPANLNQLTHLEELSVRRNPIIFDDEELATIKSMPNLKTIFVQTPRRSKNAYQESWTRIHSTHIKKLRAIEPRLCVKEIVSPESENQDTSDASDSDDEEWAIRWLGIWRWLHAVLDWELCSFLRATTNYTICLLVTPYFFHSWLGLAQTSFTHSSYHVGNRASDAKLAFYFTPEFLFWLHLSCWMCMYVEKKMYACKLRSIEPKIPLQTKVCRKEAL